jgi:hypothetical protein
MNPIYSYLTAAVLVLLGVRLLVQALRLGKSAEALLSGFLILAGGGMGIALFGVEAYKGGESEAYDLTRWAMLAVAFGMTSYAAFVWRTFRSDARWSGLLFAGLTLAIFLGWYHVLYVQTFGVNTEPHPAAFVPRLAVYLWGMSECMFAYRAHRRRMALGLADPVVVNRFLLFTLWNLCLVLPPVGNAILRQFSQEAVATMYTFFPWLMGSGLALVTVLIFFPPNAYLDYISRGYDSAVDE